MKRKHNAFTLSEVLISLAVIGVIMCFYIPVKKTVDNLYTTLGYFAYNNVNLMARQLITGMDLKNVETVEVGGIAQTILTTDDKVFCESIVDISNTAGDMNCETADLYTASGTEISGLQPDEPTFLASNGQRFYLSKRISTIPNAISSTYGYRILSVDLNGKRVPNFVAGTGSGSKYGDIISFAIIDNGLVIPVGQAATDRNYINTRVKAFRYDGGTDYKHPYQIEYLPASNGTNTMPFKEAFCNIQGSTSPVQVLYECGDPNAICPLSSGTSKADVCELELVKPVYQYKM